jgi:hypothetical protein
MYITYRYTHVYTYVTLHIQAWPCAVEPMRMYITYTYTHIHTYYVHNVYIYMYTHTGMALCSRNHEDIVCANNTLL